MKVCGIIAEFNPFHLGHKFLIDSVKKDFDAVVCIISGNIVQRGELSVIDRALKTQIALDSGVDLVLELPLPFSALSAEKFASRGVYILDSLQIIDNLAFGIQTKDTNLLTKVAKLGNTDEVKTLIEAKVRENIGYPIAFEEVIKEKLQLNSTDIFKKGNNILALEYLSALDKFNSKIEPYFVYRDDNNFPSAKEIRKKMMSGEDIKKYMPDFAYNRLQTEIDKGNAPVSLNQFERVFMAILRQLKIEDIKNAPDVVGGLENRIKDVIENSDNIKQVIEKSSSNIFTHSRIKRALVCACLKINKDDASQMPTYIKVLGHSQKGRQILSNIQNTCKLPIVMKTADVKKLPSYSRRIYEINAKGDDLYNLFVPKLKPCNTYYRENIIVK
ncbi:MAG: nucleotidyltransferase family protein [Clostridia bacterium]|nr:nucleotidyltransferase family protein [Clostridia bacterium]